MIIKFFNFFLLTIYFPLFAAQNDTKLIKVNFKSLITSKENLRIIKATYKKYYYKLTIKINKFNEYWQWKTNSQSSNFLKDILCNAVHVIIKNLKIDAFKDQTNYTWHNLKDEMTFWIQL